MVAKLPSSEIVTKECEDLGGNGGREAVGGQGNWGEGQLGGILGEEGSEGKALLMMDGGRKGRLERKRKEGGSLWGSALGITPLQTHERPHSGLRLYY